MSALSVTADRSDAIIDWLQSQRWYGDKSRTLSSVVIHDLETVDCCATRVDLAIVGCVFADGGLSSYFIPLVANESLDAPVGTIVDAFDLPAFLDWLVTGFLQDRIIVSGPRRMTWLPGNDRGALTIAHGSARLLRTEQSNTSILYGDRAIAKVFRRLEPGVNPDVEMIQHLTERTGFRHVPRYLGTVVMASDEAEQRFTLAVVQEFVASEGDGWTWLLHELETRTGASRYDSLNSIELLGKRTAELHLALALPTDDSAFSPEPILDQEISAWIQRLIDELGQTFSSLSRAEVRSEAALLMLRRSIISKVTVTRPLVGCLKTRVHGDFHLGQVLRTTADFVFIDFEGEPSRAMAQRREKMSPLKDVAGMLRSLDYAVATRERAEGNASMAGIREWGERARDSFLAGYRSSLRSSLTPLVPDDMRDFKAALDFFIVEKTLYEIRYELDNRPEWLEIPLHALEAMVDLPPYTGSGSDLASEVM